MNRIIKTEPQGVTAAHTHPGAATRLAVFAALILLALPPLQAQELTLTLTELARAATEQNLDIRKRRLDLIRAEREQSLDPYLRGTELGLTGGYRHSGSGDDGTAWTTGTSLDLPLLPQLSLGAGITLDNEKRREEELSLSLSPLAPARTTFREESVYRNALIAYRYEVRRIQRQTEALALTVLIRAQEQDLAERALAQEQAEYELALRQQAVGAVSFQSVQEQQGTVINARQQLFNSRRQYARDWTALQQLFAPADLRYEVASVSLEQLLELVAERRARAATVPDGEAVTESLELLLSRNTALETERAVTPLWRPALTVGAGITFPDPGADQDPVTTATIRLILSPAHIQEKEREELDRDREILALELAAERYGALLEADLRSQNVAIYEEALIAAQLQEERDRLSLREAGLLQAQGARTSLEISQLQINLWRSEIGSFRAAVDLYQGLAEYLDLSDMP